MANTTKVYEKIFVKKNNAGDREYIQVPYAILADPPDLSVYAKLAGGNTFTGKQTLNSPATDGYSIQAAGYIKGSWLQASAPANKGSNTGKVCVFDGAGWIYYRTPKEVIIDAECAVKYEVKKTIDFANSGALCIGKFKVYDTNITCEITSTTDVTYSGKLVIATQNYVIKQMTVYGDAANTVAPNIYIKPSTNSDPYVEVYFKPTNWSKNVVHIYGSAIAAEPTNVCTNVSAIPSTATSKPTNALNSKANLDGGNTWYGTQNFEDDVELYDLYAQGTIYAGTGGITVDDSQSQSGIFYAGDGGVKIGRQGNTNCPVELLDSAGTSGQVMTSQGDGKTPRWVSPAIKSATLSGTTLYLTL